MILRSGKEICYESDIEKTCRKLKQEVSKFKERLKMADEDAAWNARLAAEKVLWERTAAAERE